MTTSVLHGSGGTYQHCVTRYETTVFLNVRSRIWRNCSSTKKALGVDYRAVGRLTMAKIAVASGMWQRASDVAITNAFLAYYGISIISSPTT